MKIAYLDCFSGISGDMLLGAMIDAGMPSEVLDERLKALALPAYEGIFFDKTMRGPLEAIALKFRIANNQHIHRHLNDIINIIQLAQLSDQVKETSTRIFTCLAEAEAHVHGIEMGEVHFHEVGADDAILDIVGAAIALEYLEIEKIFSSPLPLGSGRVQSEHGLLPVPAPATAEILKKVQVPFIPAPGQGELVTPTGAAILASLAQFEQPTFRLEKIGIGAGQKHFSWPNILRVFIGSSEDLAEGLVMLETNIDDMNPEITGHLYEHLLSIGALDVFVTPIQMKKNRPGIIVSVLTKKSREHQVAKFILQETTTLGIRRYPIDRYEAERRIEYVQTDWGKVRVKMKILDNQVTQANPEYEDCARLAREANVPLITVYQQAMGIAQALLKKNI